MGIAAGRAGTSAQKPPSGSSWITTAYFVTSLLSHDGCRWVAKGKDQPICPGGFRNGSPLLGGKGFVGEGAVVEVTAEEAAAIEPALAPAIEAGEDGVFPVGGGIAVDF